ncbi:MAG TPA: hypothetical protein VMD05_00455 [Candidatus Nanoarchaeia archaeon]|nr:hypothetical protein [Candidatus Nanoarchaeia archaeon]
METKLVPQKPLVETLCAIQGALGEENQKIFAKASMNLGKTWGASIQKANNVEDLMGKIAAYLQNDFQLAKSVIFAKADEEYILQVRGCYVCHGKMVKERHNITPACAISLFPVGVVVENLKIRNARLKEIRKPGPPGDCDLVYEIKS